MKHLETLLLQAGAVEENSECIRIASEMLLAGEVIAFPTETVYGLGARADSAKAVERIATIKQRPPGKPFTTLVADVGEIERHAPHCPPHAQEAACRFWPGPLTLVLPAAQGEWVGLRCPDHDVALFLLRKCGVGIAAPSANRSGRPAATDARAVLEEFPTELAAVLDAGPCRLKTPSTVVRVDASGWQLLREGAISKLEIAATLGPPSDREDGPGD